MGLGGNEKTPPQLEELREREIQASKDVPQPSEKEDQPAAAVEVKYPQYLSRFFTSLAVFIMGATMRGSFVR